MTTGAHPGAEGLAWGRLKRDPARRAIVRAWRDATGGARTLAACSGGADSTALLVCLRSAGADVVCGHIVHDMRPRAEALADRDAVRALAERLGVAFVEGEARRGKGNAEASLRRARYRALAGLAREHACPFVAAAHHADDQLETVLMALLRGAGARGLGGMAARRGLAPGVELIRPMLERTREDAERLCAMAGVAWRRDPTNEDVSRVRAQVRALVTPRLKAVRPSAARHAAEAAAALRDAAGLVEERAAAVFGEGLQWSRAALRAERAEVVGAGLRAAALRLTAGVGADRLPRRVVRQAVEAVRDDKTHERVFEWMRRVGVRVDARRVGVFLLTEEKGGRDG